MTFTLNENYTEAELKEAEYFVNDRSYDAIDELGDAALQVYQAWFEDKAVITDEALEVAVKDFYIAAIDCGKIHQPKTMITSKLTKYIKENVDLLRDVDALIQNCPKELQAELKLVLERIGAV